MEHTLIKTDKQTDITTIDTWNIHLLNQVFTGTIVQILCIVYTP